MGSLYFWGRSIQEMGGNVVIGRSIYGVVVIDGSLYSRFYSMALSDGKQSFDPCPIVLVSILLQFQPDTNKFSCLQLEAENVNITWIEVLNH